MQADTIIPNAYNSQAFDRYAYVLNNPLRFTDPTGHMYCDGWDTGMGLGCTPESRKDPNTQDDDGTCHTDACRKAAAEDTYQKKYKFYQGCLNNPGSGCPDAKEIATFIGFSLALASADILGPAAFAELQGLWKLLTISAKDISKMATAACFANPSCLRILTKILPIKYDPRIANQTDIFHAYPNLLDSYILKYGDMIVKSENYAQFSAEGNINNYTGEFQIGITLRDFIFIIKHHFFSPGE